MSSKRHRKKTKKRNKRKPGGTTLSVCVIAGTWIGSQLLERVNERWFKRLYQGVLTLIAIRLVVWEGMAWLAAR